MSGGVATFTNLADNKAETISLNFTGGGLTAATIDHASSSARRRRVSWWSTPSPRRRRRPGSRSPLSRWCYEEDQFGNLETGDDSTVVTATLSERHSARSRERRPSP